MHGKKNEKVVCDVPAVLIHRRWGSPRYLIVEYDLWKVCERLSRYSLEQLERFVGSYYKANVPPPPPRRTKPQSRFGPTAGYIQVFREHAEEFAVRLLGFITDHANFEQFHDVRLTEAIAATDALAVERDQPTHKQRVEAIRQRVTSEWPEFVDDPLGQVPGAAE